MLKLTNVVLLLKEFQQVTLPIPAVEMQQSKKVGTEEYEGVMIEFGELNIMTKWLKGDKLTYSTALKGVISKRLTNDEAPLSSIEMMKSLKLSLPQPESFHV